MKEALKLALEALECALSDDKPYIVKSKEAINAIKAALAQPAQQEDDADATIIQYHEATIKRLEKRIEELAQPVQEPVAMLERDPSIGRLRVTYEDAVTELEEGVYPLYTEPQFANSKQYLERLIRIMGTFDLATGHADTFDELLDSLESELRDVLGYYRQQRPWVGLTEQELESAYWDYMAIATQNGFEKTVKAIEARWKEKNSD